MGHDLGTHQLNLSAAEVMVLIAAQGLLPSPVTLFNDRIQFLGITGLSMGASGLFSIDSQSAVDSCFLSELTGEKPNFLKNFSSDYVISHSVNSF